jgi:hypothetical protein
MNWKSPPNPQFWGKKVKVLQAWGSRGKCVSPKIILFSHAKILSIEVSDNPTLDSTKPPHEQFSF